MICASGGVRSILPSAVGRMIDERVPPLLDHVLGTQAGSLVKSSFEAGMRHVMVPFMETHAGEVLKFGVDLGTRTWVSFLTKLGWARETIDKVICHQVGAGHRDAVLKGFGIDPRKDFSTFPYLGNIGTVSLPMTAAIAEERGPSGTGRPRRMAGDWQRIELLDVRGGVVELRTHGRNFFEP